MVKAKYPVTEKLSFSSAGNVKKEMDYAKFKLYRANALLEFIESGILYDKLHKRSVCEGSLCFSFDQVRELIDASIEYFECLTQRVEQLEKQEEKRND